MASPILQNSLRAVCVSTTLLMLQLAADLSFFLLDSHAHAGKDGKVSIPSRGAESSVFSLYGLGKGLMSFSGLFLRYPSDADKHLLARQTGLSRNQVGSPPFPFSK